jgi:ribulose bisphosphate carboxylase small subunit
MNPTKYKITITTVNVPLEELEKIMEQIKNSFKKGYVVGSGWNDKEQKSYNFETMEL